MSSKRLRITYVKSVIGFSEKQRATLRSLGLRRLGQSVEYPDSPTVRGMIQKIQHLVRVDELDERTDRV
ncbi:MAG: 50S ribosomal protein L30 [Thermomicrobium sp.]|nr:50S ribosomal protein L30 [Thermomicrobium sp.]MCS7246329.1 50S ribosomal protein L30 [Thermomicrobium sp.]MDW7982420.1 50S ribosomal protein L30 [Thermomicrobium sp.]